MDTNKYFESPRGRPSFQNNRKNSSERSKTPSPTRRPLISLPRFTREPPYGTDGPLSTVTDALTSMTPGSGHCNLTTCVSPMVTNLSNGSFESSSISLINGTLTGTSAMITEQTGDNSGLPAFSTGFEILSTYIENITQSTTQKPKPQPDAIVAYVVVYGFIVLVGILFNVLAIIAISIFSKLRNAQNMFVLNICCADILLGINGLFVFISEIAGEAGTIDGSACQVLGFITFIPPIAVILSMAVIARNRHKCIAEMHPKSLMYSKTKVAISLIIVWSVATMVSLPVLIFDMPNETGFYCTCCFTFADNKIYGVTITVSMYVLPNLVIAYSYTCIFVIYYKSKKKIHNLNASSKGAVLKKADVQLATQFIALFAVFNVCYLPSMILFWVEDYNAVSTPLRAFIMLLFACTIFANPIAYLIMNKNARGVIKNVFLRPKTSTKVQPQNIVNHLEMLPRKSPNVGAKEFPNPAIKSATRRIKKHCIPAFHNQEITFHEALSHQNCLRAKSSSRNNTGSNQTGSLDSNRMTISNRNQRMRNESGSSVKSEITGKRVYVKGNSPSNMKVHLCERCSKQYTVVSALDDESFSKETN